jgi:signal transduction histidine kinase
MIGVLSDITRRKQAETSLSEAREELQLKNQELEKKVHERTAQLQEALGDLEHFAYGIAHDLRGPLRRMSQFAYLVQAQSGDRMDPTSKDFLDQIIAGGRRADTLINDVLAYSRIGRTDLKLEPVDLAALVRQVVQDYPALESSAVDFETYLPTTFVLGQPAPLTQCISNLLGNAVKFVAPGTRPHIVIGTELKGNRTRFYVRDNGIGIDRRNLDRIWKVFERVPQDDNYEGTGIGLSIVRKAIERMGGTVGVESEPGRGSTFWFELKTSELTGTDVA